MKNIFFICVLLFIISFITHISYLGNGFTWLDHGDIELKFAILPMRNVQLAFVRSYGQTFFYRPLVTVMNSIDAALYDQWAGGYHLTNLLLHCFVSVLSFFIARRIFKLSPINSMCVGLFTAVHPLSWLPVGAISYRPELLVTFFVWSTLLFYTEFRKQKLLRYAWLAQITFLGALFSKETAVFWVPGLVISWELLAPQGFFRTKKEESIQIVTTLFAFMTILGAYLYARWSVLHTFWKTQFPSMTILQAVGTRLSVIGIRILEFFDPVKPRLSDATNIVTFSWTGVLALFLLALPPVYFLIYFKKKEKNWTLLLAYLWLIIGVAPAFNILPLPRFSSPHYSYMPVVVVGCAVMILISRVSKFHRGIVFIILSVLLLLMAVSTYRGGAQFHDDFMLFTPEVTRDEHFLEGHFYLGQYAMNSKEYADAEAHFQKAKTSNPGVIAFVDVFATKNNLANVYAQQKKFEQAQTELENLLKDQLITDQRLQVTYNLANILAQQDKFVDVIHVLQPELGEFHQVEPYLLLAYAYLETKQVGQAADVLNTIFAKDKTQLILKELEKNSEKR